MEAVDRPLQRTRSYPRHAATPARRPLGAVVGALALIALLVPLQRWWAAQMLLLLLLLIVPGVILLQALRVPGQVMSSFPVYIPCASIIMLFCSGLVVDMVGPLVGVAEPLRTVPLLVGLEVTCLALLTTSVNSRSNVAAEWLALSRSAKLAWPLILPLVSAAGALRLNSGHGNGIALIAVTALVVLLVATSVVASRLNEALLEVILYAASLSLSWSYSLRGDGVYGFDITAEYQRLEQTIVTGVWHAAHPGDAYGAMLSVTVMPAELHFLSGVPGLLVLKVIYPAIYALFPVGIFDLARRLLSPRWAFVAATFTIGQYAFVEIVSGARQEIALVLFVALMMAVLDTRLRRGSQWALITLLGLAMALSHYSTTYVTITIIGLALVLQCIAFWFRKIPPPTGAMAIAFAATFAGAVIWYVPVTHSDSHLLQVAQTIEVQGLNLLPNRPPGGSLLAAYLEGNAKTPIPAAEYAFRVHEYYLGSKTFITPLHVANLPQYTLRDSTVPEPPVKWHIGYDMLSLSLLIIEQVANLLAALGSLLMILWRKSPLLTRQVGLLALVTTLLLTALRFSGTLAVAYGQERAQLQGLVLLAIVLGWVMQGIASARKAWHTRVVALTAICLTVILVNTTYLVSAMLGGQTSVNLANSGAAFEFFYISAPELASAQWLGETVRPGELVYADEYGQLPVAEMTELQQGLLLDPTPLTLNQHAWVYASRTNVINGRAFGLYNEHLAIYVFPASFLNANYDLVYTDGSSEVFHR